MNALEERVRNSICHGVVWSDSKLAEVFSSRTPPCSFQGQMVTLSGLAHFLISKTSACEWPVQGGDIVMFQDDLFSRKDIARWRCLGGPKVSVASSITSCECKNRKKLDGAGGGERLAVRPPQVLWRVGGVVVAASVRWRGGAVTTAARRRRCVSSGAPTIHEREHVGPETLGRPQAAAPRPPPAGDGAASSRRQLPASDGGQP